MEGWRRASRACGEPRYTQIYGACETVAGRAMSQLSRPAAKRHVNSTSSFDEGSHVTRVEVLHKRRGCSVEAFLISCSRAHAAEHMQHSTGR